MRAQALNRFGPRITSEGVSFQLWAPDAREISLEIEGRHPLPMKLVAPGWFQIATDCEPGARYRFRWHDLTIPDPASRLQSGGVHGWSVVRPSVPAKTFWPGRPWEDSVIYECHVGLMGGFAGVMAQLPRLAELGITVLELMPIAAFPGERNWGYDGVLLFAPAEAYGPPELLRALIEKAHDLHLSVILDVVFNHFGPDGNYLHLYAKRFFRDDVHTPWGSAIDFRQPEVRDFFFENASYWLEEFGFDGLRLDAVHTMRDEGWLAELPARLRGRLVQHELKLVVENENNGAGLLQAGYDGQWNDDIHHALHLLLTGEAHSYYEDYRDHTAVKLAKGLAEGFIYQGEYSSIRGDFRGEPSGQLAPTSFINFLQNHDQTGNRPFGERLTVLAPINKLRAAIALVMLCPQIPMLFMGEEKGTTAPFLYFTDHTAELAQQVREGRRREFAHFAEHGNIPDANDPDTYLRSKPESRRESEDWFDFYRNLIDLRRRHIVPKLKGTKSSASDAISNSAIRVSWRLGDGAKLTLAANLGDASVRCTFPTARPIFGQIIQQDRLEPDTTVAWLEP